MSLSGKRVYVLAEQQYQELEVWYPYYRLKEAGAEATIVGPKQGRVVLSKVGYPCTIERSVADARGADADAVVIPGGFAPDFMRRDDHFARIVREAADAGKVVAAICHGGWMLASADVIRGRRVTSFFAIRDDMVHAGAEWIDAEVCVDGRIVTARKPDDLPAFCREIIRLLEES